jgi:hypothetical protein
VIAAFQINIRKRVDAVVDDDVKPVALADRGDRAAGAVAEELCNLVLGRQIDFVIELHPQILQVDVVRGRKHGEQVAAVTAEHDGFGHAVAGDVANLRSACRRHCRLVLDHLVGDDLIQVSLQGRCDGHGASSIAERNRFKIEAIGAPIVGGA